MGAKELIMENLDEMGLIRDFDKAYEERTELRDYNCSYGNGKDFLSYTEYQLVEELLPTNPMGEGLHGEKLLVAPKDVNLERIALYWYFRMNDGEIFDDDSEDSYIPMDESYVSDLIIITSEWKKEAGIWQRAMIPFLLSTNKECNYYDNRVVVDNWENIAMYAFEKECYFIFDEYEYPLSCEGCEEAADSFFTIVDTGQLNTWIMATTGREKCGVFPAFCGPSELF